MIPALIGAGASIIGGLLGSKNKAPTTTQKSEPWSAVQPWLKDNIATGQKLQAQYEAQPFSPLQQQAYANLFADNDNFRTNVVPGLLSWANNAMQGGYQRQNVARPGMVGYGPSVQQPMQQPMQPTQPMPTVQPKPGAMAGLLNFAPPPAQTQAQAPTMPTNAEAFDKAMQEYQRRELERQMYTPSQNWFSGFGG